MEKEEKKGRDKKNEKAWRKANKISFTVNLMKSTDKDIIDYLDREVAAGKSRQGVIKEAIREKISREKEV